IFGFLLWFSLPVFQGNALGYLFSWHWRPLQGDFGIMPMFIGSLCLALPAMLLAFPVALGLCGFVHGIGPSRVAHPLLGVIRFMTSIPTVVYGLVSAFLLVPLIRSGASGSGFSWLAALLTLSVLVLPTIVLILDNQFRLVQDDIRLGAIALGFTPIQQFLKLTLPLSVRGLLMAATLGFGRAIGDTLIPLMLAGNAPQLPHSLLDSIRTLTSHIALVVATDSQSEAYSSLFACGLILFLVSLLVNAGLQYLRGTQRIGQDRNE
ncbi:MAG: ABC transporter permease subunit, partial [Burkholderiaceae bacterium]|nr:ABC transporter permease subunit [Burkholderiaceae bacterium]